MLLNRLAFVFPGLVAVLASGIASVSAASVQDACANLEKCALSTAELTGTKYVFETGTLKSITVTASANYALTKENAEEIFTQMLDQNGFTRLPLAEEKAYTILRQRDARDSALPIFVADVDTTPAIPETWDLATLRYQTPRPHLCEHIARTMRSFMPGNSRIIPDELTGQLLVTAAQPILAAVLAKIQVMDVPVAAKRLRLKRPSTASGKNRGNRPSTATSSGE